MTRKRRRRRSPPSYRLHRSSGQAVVTLNGRDHYLGPHGSQTSLNEYDRLIAEWLAGGRRLPEDERSFSLNELLLLYVEHAEAYYRKAGRETSQAARIRAALRFVADLYGDPDDDGDYVQAADFGPLMLKACREKMIAEGLTRYTCNEYTSEIRRMFAWGVAGEHIEATQLHALKSVPSLLAGRSGARETNGVPPVPWEHVEAVRPELPEELWAMIRLQDLTGMRPGEVCLMRPCDVDRSGRLWYFRPEAHKGEHHCGEREIGLGPQAQQVAEPFLQRTVDAAYLFSPAEVERRRRERLRAERKSPVQPSQRDRRKPAPRRTPGERYTTDSYRRAIRRAVEKANKRRAAEGLPEVPAWSPHQLRHNAATRARKIEGLETAQLVLGHKDADVTQVYAERDRDRAAAYLLQHG